MIDLVERITAFKKSKDALVPTIILCSPAELKTGQLNRYFKRANLPPIDMIVVDETTSAEMMTKTQGPKEKCRDLISLFEQTSMARYPPMTFLLQISDKEDNLQFEYLGHQVFRILFFSCFCFAEVNLLYVFVFVMQKSMLEILLSKDKDATPISPIVSTRRNKKRSSSGSTEAKSASTIPKVLVFTENAPDFGFVLHEGQSVHHLNICTPMQTRVQESQRALRQRMNEEHIVNVSRMEWRGDISETQLQSCTNLVCTSLLKGFFIFIS